MSKIKNGALDQYGAEPFERQQFGTAGVEGVNKHPMAVRLSWLENAYSRPLFQQAIFTRKVGQSDLVFGTRSVSL